MCGIAGILRTDQKEVASSDILDRMLQSIVHRGPDDDGHLIDGELAMGMRRLAIIDIADGKQPIFDESKRFAVISNGEIYNYLELQQELLARGHQLKTHSDTEVIVHLYEELGISCVEQLRGMFAIAIWDSQERELVLIRDRLGVKPLYYAEIDGSLVFASEIKAILQHPKMQRQVNLSAMSNYLSLRFVPAPQTMFDGIHSLPPGCFLRVRQGKIQCQPYWDISYQASTQSLSDQEYEERLLELLRESIGLHLRSDVPFGAFLSGGVDSSLIVALMSEKLKQPVKTFSVGFDSDSVQDELPYAQLIADRFGCDHHTIVINSTDFLAHAEKVIWHLDQPISDQATVAMEMVSQLAAQHVKMVLTGEGGDELFAGYARYVGNKLAPMASWLPKPMRKLMRVGNSTIPGLRRTKIGLNALSYHDEATRIANWFPMFNDQRKAQLFSDAKQHLARGAADVMRLSLDNCNAKNSLDRMLYVDCKLWLPDYLLLRGDKLTMVHSLEGRVPLLDHKLVEFVATLPARLKLNGTKRKYLLRQVASKLLPTEVVHRKKQGFPIPIDRWFRGEAREWMRDHLSPATIQRRGWFDAKFIARLISEHESGHYDHSTELWGLVNLEIWMRRFIDRRA